MPIVADLYPHVVGVDTHARTHTFAILTGQGRLIDTATFPTSKTGMGRAIDWIGRRTAGDIGGTLITAEGTSSYGAQLTQLMAEHGYRVVEAPTPARGRNGKTDVLDARLAASSTLTLDETQLRDHRRHGETRDTIAALITLRDHYTELRTSTLNMLTGRPRDFGRWALLN